MRTLRPSPTTVERVKGWLRLWVVIPNAVAGRAPLERDMLIVIDEMPRIGFLKPVLDGYTMAAGKGVHFWCFAQSISALDSSDPPPLDCSTLRLWKKEAIRLVMLTGCRRKKIGMLRWTHVDIDAGELRLEETKTGACTITLPPRAIRLLAALPRLPNNPWIIAGPRPSNRPYDMGEHWRRVRARHDLHDVPFLRHSWASCALRLGESLQMIASLLDHSQVETTTRYTNLARDSVHEAASLLAASSGADLLLGDQGDNGGHRNLL